MASKNAIESTPAGATRGEPAAGTAKKTRTVRSAMERLAAAEKSLNELRRKATEEALHGSQAELTGLKGKIAKLEECFVDPELKYNYESVANLIGELVRQRIPASSALKLITGKSTPQTS